MAKFLTDLSDALAETVASAGASVVRVEARHRLPATGIVWSPAGLVVTAHHVVEWDENIVVGLPGGDTVEAELVGRDPTTDLAALRTQATGLSAPEWAPSDGLWVGHLVLALGRLGSSVRATMGIVGALGDSWRTPSGGMLDRYLQTDVVMYPGFSGGPLVDAGGRMVGLNTSAILRGISLTVPYPTISRVVEALSAHGRVRRAYLGVGSQPTRLPESLAQRLGQHTGLLLVSVEPDSPAEQGGLFLGDTLVALAGQPVKQLDDLMANLSAEMIGKSVPVRIVRGGELLDLNVVAGEGPQG